VTLLKAGTERPITGAMNPQAAALQGYRESSVLTAPPERLVVMLYEGADRFLRQAAVATRTGQPARANDRLQRVEAILDELIGTLDMSTGEIAERLQDIYLFCRRALMEARLERDAGKIDEVARLLGELRGAWATVAGA